MAPATTSRPPARHEHRYYQARGAAAALWRDCRPECLVSGPAGTGKSRACLEKLHACCLRWPGTRALIVRKTRESLTESALVTYEQNVLVAGDPVASGPRRRMRQAYRYPNGSEVVVGGLDKPSKVMSTEYDLVYVQEAIELHEGDWESLTTRLRNGVMPFQQLIADTNPDAPTHWLRRRADAGRVAIHESRHEDNPVIWDASAGAWTPLGAAYIAKLDALSGPRRDRLRFGRWVAAEGLVYADWDRAVHLVDRFAIPASWRRVRSVDFGWTNPFVCLWAAIDPDGRAYVYRELYRTARLVADHARQVVALSEGERIEATVADHDAEDRATLHAHGVPTLAAYKAIAPGLQAVEARLRPAGDGRPRLFAFRDALVGRDPALAEARRPACLAEEIDGYVWPKGQDGRALKEVPVGVDDHAMDALRYLVAYLDLTPRPGAMVVGGRAPSLSHAPPRSSAPMGWR